MSAPSGYSDTRLWKGFNLTDYMSMASSGAFNEDDFRWIRDWGFTFVRIPLCYRKWIRDGDPGAIDEAGLQPVDRAVEWGERCGLHVCLNLHRAPGYSVNRDFQEPFDLWTDAAAQDLFRLHWETLARRYMAAPPARLSFNLVNEPWWPGEDGERCRANHARIMRGVADAIRRITQDRPVVFDGIDYGNTALPELADVDAIQSCRGYQPFELTHCGATWVNRTDWPTPTWPVVTASDERQDRAWLEDRYAPWRALAARGVRVHCGEFGAFRFTPHDVVLRWMRDLLSIMDACKFGWTLWNFRGAFGILDSGRADVRYEPWHGRQLDRRMLDVLQGRT